MKFKHESLEMFKGFKLKVDKQIGKYILTLRLVRGKEYLKWRILDYLKEN